MTQIIVHAPKCVLGAHFQMYFHAPGPRAQTQRATTAAVVAIDRYDTLVLPRHGAVPVTCSLETWVYVNQARTDDFRCVIFKVVERAGTKSVFNDSGGVGKLDAFSSNCCS